MGVLETWGRNPFSSFFPSFQVDAVKVTPEEMYQKAKEVSLRIQALEQLFSDIQDTMAHTQSYWIGEAGELHRNLLQKRGPDMSAILNTLHNHVQQLEQMAGNYISHEASNVEYAEQLPADVII